jgi:hypothetical protein
MDGTARVLELVESGFMTFDTVVVMPCPGRCRDNLVVKGRDFCSKDTLKVGKKVKSGKVFLNTTVCNHCLPAMATRPFGDRSGWDSQGNIRRTMEWTQQWFGEPIRFGISGQDGERLAITLGGQWLTWCLTEGYWFGKVSNIGFEMVSLEDVKRFSPLSVYGAVTEDRKVVELIIGYDMIDSNDTSGDSAVEEIEEIEESDECVEILT